MNTKTNLNNVLRNVEANLFDCRHGSELTTAEQNKAIKIAKQKVGSAILLKQLARVSPHVKMKSIVVKGL